MAAVFLRNFLPLLLFGLLLRPISGDVFKIGYVTGSYRLPGDSRHDSYDRPGLSISGALTLALDEIKQDPHLLPNHTLELIVAETFGLEEESIKRVAELRERNVSVIIGPQETCIYEARYAAAFNIPMISYVSTLYHRAQTPDSTRLHPCCCSVLINCHIIKQSSTKSKNIVFSICGSATTHTG